MNIVVLAGGTSTERSVSIVSGTMICNGLREKGHRAILVDVFCGLKEVDWENLFPEEYSVEDAVAYINSFNDDIESLKKTRRVFFGENVIEICQKADIVFLALHGENGENGKVQAAFDLLGVKYTGTGYLSSALAMDKELSKQMFRYHGVPVAHSIVVSRGEELKTAREYGFDFPCVIKVCCGGSSVGVTIPQNEEQFHNDMVKAFELEENVMIEQFIKGREFSVGVINGKALPIIEIAPISGFYDYENKYKPGSTVETCPAVLTEAQTEEMQKQAENAYHALGMTSYGRIDFMMNGAGEMFCLEANTLPGMTPTSLLPQEAAAEGISFPELCENLIRVSLKED